MPQLIEHILFTLVSSLASSMFSPWQVHGMQSHGKRKLYMILFYAGLQPLLIWWMTSHLFPMYPAASSSSFTSNTPDLAPETAGGGVPQGGGGMFG